MTRLVDALYIVSTVLFTVYGQLILKWRIAQLGALPSGGGEKVKFLLVLLLDPVILSGFVAAFLAALSWMAAMTKYQLSFAYPFMSLNFVLVLALSGWLLNETVTVARIIGVFLIVVGTVVAARG
jgi:drug/metabolite transporter (DMT)-like permease